MGRINKEEFLLATLAEQCGNVSKPALDALKFGMDNLHSGISNRTNLRIQFCKLLAIADMLRDEGVELFNLSSNSDMRTMREHVKETKGWIEDYVDE